MSKTIGELAQEFDRVVAGLSGAVKAAQNGKPIILPGGQPAAVKGPQIGDLLLALLHGQQLTMQSVFALGNMLGGGFVLTDAEAARIADLVIERLKASDVK